MAQTSKSASKPLVLNWQLDDLFQPDQFDQLYQQIDAAVAEYEQWYAKLIPDMSTEDFIAYQQFTQGVGDTLSRLSARPELEETLDQTNETAIVQKNRVKDLALRLDEVTRKIRFWFNGKTVDDKPPLDEKNAKRLFAAVPELEYSLNFSRRAAQYTLAEREEAVIVHKDANGLSVLVDLRDLLVSEHRYNVRPTGQKSRVYNTEEEVRALMLSPDAAVRRAAYEAVLGTYQDNLTRYFLIYQAVVKDWDYEARIRGYTSPIAMRNLANQVPDRAIEVLMQVCEQNVDVFREYFRFKARELGLAKLSRFDVYAPLGGEVEAEFPLAQAIELVLETYQQFSPQFAAYAQRIIDDSHVDSAPRKGKRGGAFCATITHDLSPYVMLNYTNTLRDVSTLAHELGHGVHSLYAANLPSSVQHASLPLAETASTFGEMVLFEKLLAEAKDDQQRKIMLSDKMNDSYAAIGRQSYFVRAEIEIHQRMEKGMTPTELNQLWLRHLSDLFGDSVEIDPIFGTEWATIPHIVHTPFYCYAYNFGELLSLSLYGRYKKEGKIFVPKIEAILAAGGSRDPQVVLREVGIDMSSADFWQGSFEILRDWMNQLQKLASK